MTRPANHALFTHARRNAARAFTLLELLMVLGVAIALASLVMPLYTPMLERQEFDSTVDAAVAQCEQARAAAQERGMAIELVVTDAGTRLEARPVDLLADAEDDVDTNGHFHVDGMEKALQGSAAARALGAKMERKLREISPGVRRGNESDLPELNEPWTSLDLGMGVSASVEAPEQSDQRAEFTGGTDGRVALFLPDGSAIAARGCWLTWGTRSVRVDVNPLLGHAARRDVMPPKVEARDDV
jgi:hypothetical protein